MTFEEADTINQGIRVLSLRSRARAAALLSDLGLHPGQEVMLLELSRNGPLHQAQLSDRLSCEPPSITLMARKLEAAGYISRRQSKTDKRAVLVELTPAGRDLIEPIRRRWRILAEETIANLEKDAIAALTIILSQIGQSLGGS